MHTLRLFLVVAVVCIMAPSVPADCTSCPACGNRTCHAVPVTTSVKKNCYEVEREEICVPQVCFPWHLLSGHRLLGKLCGGCTEAHRTSCDDQCNDSRCGRVITVKVLKKVSYKCDSCGYAWEMNDVDTGCTDADTSAEADIPQPPYPSTVNRYQRPTRQMSTINFR